MRARKSVHRAAETNFFFKVVDSPLTFVKNGKGEVTKFNLSFRGRQLEAVKVGDAKPQPDEVEWIGQ